MSTTARPRPQSLAPAGRADPPAGPDRSPPGTASAAVAQLQALTEALATADAGASRRHHARRLAHWQLALADRDTPPVARRRVPWGNPFAG